MGRCLRPKPGARALDAGPRKQVRSLGDDRLPPTYWPLKPVSARRDDVHQLAGDLDHPRRRPAVEVALHVL